MAVALLVWLLAVPGPAAADADRADVLYERGARALRQGDVDQALESLARAYELSPNDAGVVGLYVQALLSAGRASQAAELLEAQPVANRELLLGLARFQQGDFAAAREQLGTAVARDPRSAVAHLYLGAAHLELGDYAAAEQHLARAESLDPALAAHVEFRRGRLALRRGDPVRAEGHFREAERLAPGSPLGRAAAAERRGRPAVAKPWSFYATLGGAFDTNVNLVGDESVSQISQARDVRGFGELGFDYLLVDGPWYSLKAGGSVFNSYHEDERDFDQFNTRMWTSGSIQLLDQLSADFRYSYEIVLADYAKFRRTHVLEPGLRFRPRPGLLTRVFFRFEDRRFWDELEGVPLQALDRDGRVRTPGIEQYWFFPDVTGWGQGFVRVGYRQRIEDTDGSEYDSTGYQGNLMIGLPLPAEFFLLAAGSWEKRHYESPSVAELAPPLGFGTKLSDRNRRDWIREGRLALRRPLTENVTGEVGWRVTRWASSAEFFDFRRHIINFLVTYRY